MMPPVFELLNASSAVQALLGSSPLRVFPFGEAPEKTPYPYVTYQIIIGEPQNHLNQLPKNDKLGTQIDIWGDTADSALDVASVVRDALEPHAHMIGTGSTTRDPDTKSYRVRLDFDFFKER
jgi:hypothetical protein